MKIAVLGLGYVGSVTGACLAERGHSIVGVDVNRQKVAAFGRGEAPVSEPGLQALLSSALQTERLSATGDAAVAVAASDMSILCVGTPSRRNGSLDTTYVEAAARDIGLGLRQAQRHHTVAVRSTVLPGTTESLLLPILAETSGKSLGDGFGICMVPEFLREGTAIADFATPPFTIIGQIDSHSGKIVEELLSDVEAPLFTTDLGTAEMIKYACNAFHGLKVGFANEIGRLSRGLGVDARRVMEIFCSDKKLNLSPYYLRPGFAFGGSCLPKDLRALISAMRDHDVRGPLLEAALETNAQHLNYAREILLGSGHHQIGFLGLSFKAGTDDLRESPAVELVESLLGKGREISIYDRNIVPGRLVGANKEYVETHLPHLEKLLRASGKEVVDGSQAIVVCTPDEEFRETLEGADGAPQMVLDLVGTLGLEALVKEGYVGICW